VSEQITRIVATFKARLGMQPPSQLLSDAWTFTKALRLQDSQLSRNLNGLLQLLQGDLAAAQRLAQQHAGVLLSSSFAGILGRVDKLGQLLGLQKVTVRLWINVRMFVADSLTMHQAAALQACCRELTSSGSYWVCMR
jgi:hypothetical protein